MNSSLPVPSDSIREFFQQRHVPIRKEWLDAAIAYAATKCNSQMLLNVVFDQWIFSEIMDTTRPMLANLLGRVRPHHSIDGCIALQVKAVRDIGTSKMAQEKAKMGPTACNNAEFQDETDENAPHNFKEKERRMLEMMLTDGVTIVKALEYSAIPKLSSEMEAGSKVLVFGSNGSLIYRKGVLLVTHKNCQFLGGSVGQETTKVGEQQPQPQSSTAPQPQSSTAPQPPRVQPPQQPPPQRVLSQTQQVQQPPAAAPPRQQQPQRSAPPAPSHPPLPPPPTPVNEPAPVPMEVRSNNFNSGINATSTPQRQKLAMTVQPRVVAPPPPNEARKSAPPAMPTTRADNTQQQPSNEKIVEQVKAALQMYDSWPASVQDAFEARKKRKRPAV